MKKPSKIYLSVPIEDKDIDCATWDTVKADKCINIEYICKETLIKKLKSWKLIEVNKQTVFDIIDSF